MSVNHIVVYVIYYYIRSYWRKYVHEVLVNRLGGLSLPRKSVVRLTDRPDMTLDVYRGRKTTKQQHYIRTYQSFYPYIHPFLFLSIYCSARQCLRAYGMTIICFSLHSQWIIWGSRPAGGGNLFNRKRGGLLSTVFRHHPPLDLI